MPGISSSRLLVSLERCQAMIMRSNSKTLLLKPTQLGAERGDTGAGKLRHALVTRCSVPMYDGTESVAINKDETWARFFMEAPARRRRCVERYNIVKRA